jgi:Na+/citrate or Na+/malate symporter
MPENIKASWKALFHGLMSCLVGLFVGWLVCLFVGWLVGWLFGWSVDCLVGRLVRW